jgi:predicted nucleic acid-binding Zn ribbon protein
MAATAVTKRCVKCGLDVSDEKRMKDANGKYWCIPCGQADSRVKHASDKPSVACADCHATYPPGQMETVGGEVVCKGCLVGRRKAEARAAGRDYTDDSPDRGRRLKLVIAATMLVIGVALLVLHLLDIL